MRSISKRIASRVACALGAAVVALPLLATDAGAQNNRYGNYGNYGAGPGDFNRGDGYRSNQDPRWRREPGLVLYSRGGFGGRNVQVDGDMPDLRQVGFNDRASSLRVNWGVWEVCQHVNFGGRCARVDRSVSNFGRMGDEISSVRLVDGRGPRGHR